MYFIFGLGNPETSYLNTYHNIGFLFIDFMFSYFNENASFDQGRKKNKSIFQTININNKKVYLIKPQTFMNLSGDAVRDFKKEFKVNLDQILVVQDDVDLDFGQVKFQINRGHGGHNGIKDIHEKLQSKDYYRLKIGIGKKYPTDKYVLSKFSKEHKEKLKEIFEKVLKTFLIFEKEGFEKACLFAHTKES